MPSIKHQFKHFHYNKTGTGRAVVFLHGFLECKEIWDQYARALAPQYTIISIDLPGHGESDCIGEKHTMQMMSKVVSLILDEENIKLAHLVGHSMGGYVALSFAKQYGNRALSITLFHSTAEGDSYEKKLGRLRAIEAVRSSRDMFVKRAILNLFSKKSQQRIPKQISEMQELGARTSKQGIINALAGMRERTDHVLMVEQFSIQIQYILGSEDPVLPLKGMKSQLSIDGTNVHIVKGVGHMGFIEAPEECLEALTNFLQKAN